MFYCLLNAYKLTQIKFNCCKQLQKNILEIGKAVKIVKKKKN